MTPTLATRARRRLTPILVAGFIGLIGCAQEPVEPNAESPAESKGTALETVAVAPPLDYRARTLDNGLRVYAIRDASTASVSVHVWYDVGSKDDPKDRSGFAHLFEHIMFKSTRNMPAEFFDRLTEDVGGFNNASTYDDFTNYYEEVPAAHLERILWAEAERMGSLVVDDEIFEAERDVVKEELRQRVLASPYGRLFYLYSAQANYDVHPYGRPGIGSIGDLDAATADDVRAFHATYYRPDNAVLVVSGNFDDADLDRWVDQYFGPIERPDRPIPEVDVEEPAREAPRDYTTYAPNVPLPAVMTSWPGLAARDSDLPALMVLDAVLSRGESSRLYQSLVYEQQIASEAFSYFEPTRDPSAFSIGVILSADEPVERGVEAIAAEVARLRDAPISAAELSEAKNELVTEKLQSRETAYGRAFELADAVIRYDDPAYADKLLAAVEAVTAADVARLAERLFNENARVTIRYLNDDDAPAAGGDVIITPATIEAAPLDAPAQIRSVELAPADEREAPPAPGAPVAAQVPTASETTLDNGLRVIVAPRRGLPLISADLRVRAGSSRDPADRAGLAGLAAELTTKGTASRSAVEIAQAVEALGASLTPDANDDASYLSLQTRADRADTAFELLADAAINPVFADEELERARRQAIDDLAVALSEPSAIAGRAITRAVFGASAYGGVASPRSLEAISSGDARAFHAAGWRPDSAVLVIAGDVSPEDGFQLAERHFGAWRPVEADPLTAPDAAPALIAPAVIAPALAADGPRRIVIDLPDAGQAAVAYGGLGAPRRDDDFLASVLAANVLGGGYSSRLNTEIRIKRGLSYGAGTSLPPRLAAPLIYSSTQTRNDAAVQVAELIETEMARLAAEKTPADELGARKAVLIGRFGRSVETTSGLAGQYASLALFDLPFDRLQTFVGDIEAIDADAVKAAAARYFDPSAASLVVVGDAETFFNDFKARYPNAERISIEALNLDSAALR